MGHALMQGLALSVNLLEGMIWRKLGRHYDVWKTTDKVLSLKGCVEGTGRQKKERRSNAGLNESSH